MATDEERREIARRLRELRSGWSSGECYYTIINALGLPDTSREDGGAALYALLADLIEPSDSAQTVAGDMFGQMRHSTEQERVAYADMLARNSVELHPVDRDALLELADEMETYKFPISGEAVAEHIREACGEACDE